jgi:hypothetical protein
MIHRLSLSLLGILLAAAATPALAKDVLSYSYWDAAYLSQEIEGDGGGDALETEGFRLGFDLGLMKFLSFSVDYDQSRDGGDRIGFGSAGLAYHTQNPEYQFFGGASYERIVTKGGGVGEVEEGYGVEIGGRYMLPDVELHAAVRYLDYGSAFGTEADLTGLRYVLGADVQLCPWWSLIADYRGRRLEVDGAGVSAQTDYTGFTVGFRRYFVSATDRRNRSGGLLNGLFSGGGEEAPAAE